MVFALHGRPHSSFRLQKDKVTPVYDLVLAARKNPQVKGFLTFWPEHHTYWVPFLGGKPLAVIAPPVDLKAWSADGPRGYGFHGKRTEINAVVTDVWRKDVDPFHCVSAFRLYARWEAGASLHVYGTDPKTNGLSAILTPLRETRALGEMGGWVKAGLPHVYRAADVVLTPHRIATRTVREAMACGCQVVAGGGPYAPHGCSPFDQQEYARTMAAAVAERQADPEGTRAKNRQVAEAKFDPINSAKGLLKFLEDVL